MAEQYGPGRPASATSQPWEPYVVGEEGFVPANPNVSQPISPAPPQNRDFFFKREDE